MSHPTLANLLAGDDASLRHLAGCAECRRLVELAAEPEEGPRYQRGEVVHVGGMGRTVRAVDRVLGREVLLKEALPGLGTSPAAVHERFEREARLTARLTHPSILPVYDLGRGPDGEPFYAMPLIEGQTFAELIRQTRPEARLGLVRHVAAIADAIAFAHSRGVVHRDIKPENVLIGRFGQVVVIDWGLAAEVGRPDAPSAPAPANPGPWTRLGVGTPAYMSPEQAAGVAADPRQDVYALGATLYHALAGTPPWGPSGPATIRAGMGQDKRPPSLGRVARQTPTALLSLVERAMEPDPDRRFPSAVAMAADLSAWLDGGLLASHRYRPAELLWRWIRARRALLSTLAAAAVAAALVGVASFREVLAARDAALNALEDSLAAQSRLLASDPTQTAPALAIAARATEVALNAGNLPDPATEAALRVAWRAGPAARRIPGTAGWSPRVDTPSGLLITDPSARFLRVRPDGITTTPAPVGHPMGLVADPGGDRWLALYREGFGVFGRRVAEGDALDPAFPLPVDGVRAHLLPDGAAILADREVAVVDGRGRLRWRAPLPAGAVAITGTPREVWVGDGAGTLHRFHAADGSALPPLARGLPPLRVAHALPDQTALVGLADGGILWVQGGVGREVARLGHAVDFLSVRGPCASATAGEAGIALFPVGPGCSTRSWENVRGGGLREDGSAILILWRDRACVFDTPTGEPRACVAATSADLGGGLLGSRVAYLMGLEGVLLWDAGGGLPPARSEIVAIGPGGTVASRDGAVRRLAHNPLRLSVVTELPGGISAAGRWGDRLLVGTFDGVLLAVDLQDRMVRGEAPDAVSAVVPSSQGVWIGTWDGHFSLRDPNLRVLSGWTVPGGVRGALLADHGPVTWGTDGRARRWTWRGTPIGAVGDLVRPVASVVRGEDGATWLALPQGATRWREDGTLDAPLSGRLLGLASDGRVITSHPDGRVGVYDRHGRPLRNFQAGSRAPRALIADQVVADDGGLWTLTGQSLGGAPAPWTASDIDAGWRIVGDLRGGLYVEPLEAAALLAEACQRAAAVGEPCPAPANPSR